MSTSLISNEMSTPLISNEMSHFIAGFLNYSLVTIITLNSVSKDQGLDRVS